MESRTLVGLFGSVKRLGIRVSGNVGDREINGIRTKYLQYVYSDVAIIRIHKVSHLA